MASNSERGHTKNVSGLQEIIKAGEQFGLKFKPSNPRITLAKLQVLLAAAKGAISDVLTAKTTYDDVTNAREVAFRPLPRLATRILNAVVACEAPQEKIDDVNSSVIKIQGRRAKPLKKPKKGEEKPPVPEEKPAEVEGGKESQKGKNHSVSQLSFDKQIEHLETMISTLTSEPKYQPNEDDLTISALTDVLNDLKDKNLAALNVTKELSFARMNRNKILYDPVTGLVDTAQVVKAYVISLYDTKSPEYKQISGIKFYTPSKK